jgi:hypothetical protein
MTLEEFEKIAKDIEAKSDFKKYYNLTLYYAWLRGDIK